MINTLSKKYFSLGLSLIFLGLALQLHQISVKPIVNIGKQETAYNLNQNFLKMLSIGNQRMLSNVIWIQTLLESDQEKFKQKNYTNWMYLRFLTISTLDPFFYENYLYGGMYLSVVKDDLYGAANIFDLGLKIYPSDYRLNYYAGFNYFFELGDYKKGYDTLKKIENHPETPPNIRLIINKLRFETTKDYDTALNFLKHNLQISKDEFVRYKIKSDIYALSAERDLECLNNKKTNCNLVDVVGNKYILTNEGLWKSQQKFEIYKINRPEAKVNSTKDK